MVYYEINEYGELVAKTGTPSKYMALTKEELEQ